LSERRRGDSQEEATIGKQLHAARKRKADEFQAFADGTLQDADRCVTLWIISAHSALLYAHILSLGALMRHTLK